MPTDRQSALGRLGKLRQKASAEIERLVDFLDASDIDPDLEEIDMCEPIGDEEASLGSLDRAANQDRWGDGAHSWGAGDVDRELDRGDDEPSLGAVELHPCCLESPNGSNPTGNQTHWAAGGLRDLKHDPAESGIADLGAFSSNRTKGLGPGGVA
ncbi:hypothetical protein H8B02_12095 [Bradyrhizobium sp. Pear77]|uniref:hypothetical protein n=1 Tax=Bradyrhizobium altum TaxID=1571202 RepID=UPI001E5B5BDA|nr:hypothetical protein [Bradyrhizobium altum]MCC8954166.1 hypothetical protein [Bradyrhizobium altum]